MKLRSFFPGLIAALLITLAFASCGTVDLFEKTVSMPRHEWASSYKPSFDFKIGDSLSTYKVFLILRHNERYTFNNLYLNLYIKGPGQDTAQRVQRDLELGSNEKGWLGTAMDDIYEHRILLAEQGFRPGEYHFTLEQLMREDPLMNVLNTGIRVERVNP